MSITEAQASYINSLAIRTAHDYNEQILDGDATMALRDWTSWNREGEEEGEYFGANPAPWFTEAIIDPRTDRPAFKAQNARFTELYKASKVADLTAARESLARVDSLTQEEASELIDTLKGLK